MNLSDYHVLLAKRVKGNGEVPYAATLYGHLQQVLDVVDVMLDVLDDKALSAVLEDGTHLHLFRKALRVSAVLHDIGKGASPLFQRMIHTGQAIPQEIRHEAISEWLIRNHSGIRKVVYDYLGNNSNDPIFINHVFSSIRAAVLGHHLKLPQLLQPTSNQPLKLIVDHPDFEKIIGLIETVTNVKVEVCKEIEPVILDIDWIEKNIYNPLEQDLSLKGSHIPPSLHTFTSLLRSLLIAADSLGSIFSMSRQDWTEHHLPLIRYALEGIDLQHHLEKLIQNKLSASSIDSEIEVFQQSVAESKTLVTIVEAGCGAGKTIAAYRWGKSRDVKNLFITYPTTATATQGFADYATVVDEVAKLLHSRSLIDLEWLSSMEESESPLKGNKTYNSLDDSLNLVLEQLHLPLNICTVDRVLGMFQNHYASLCLLPKVLNGAVVFDEVHAYDEVVFQHFLEFLATVKVPTLIMTASLQPNRKQAILETLSNTGIEATWLQGPSRYEERERYVIHVVDSIPEKELWDALQKRMKVLLVANQVQVARDLFERLSKESEVMAPGTKWFLYHSRFEYEHRLYKQKAVVNAFRTTEPVCVVTTQICEMSFDISADLLFSEIADFPSLVQRLGRLNRRAKDGDMPKNAYFWRPESEDPYRKVDLDQASEILLELVNYSVFTGKGISQKKLNHSLISISGKVPCRKRSSELSWRVVDQAEKKNSIREASYSIDCIRASCLKSISKRSRIEIGKHVIPMPKLKKGLDSLKKYEHLYVVPDEMIEYTRDLGGRWRNDL